MKKSYQEIKDSPALSYISQMQTQNDEQVQSEEVIEAQTVTAEETVDNHAESLE